MTERDMTSLRTIRARAAGAAALVAAGLLIAACGASGSHSSTGAGTNAASVHKAHTGAAITIATTQGSGAHLVGQGGRAIYLWAADKGNMSTCSGACAQSWPPVLTTGTPKRSGAVKSSLLGTTKRADGSTEVTYRGHPLYYYAGDTSSGSTTGQGSTSFGAPWWLVSPSGAEITSGA
jgi:predicted lipoprotein with Yx(FWY)xxD motif